MVVSLTNVLAAFKARIISICREYIDNFIVTDLDDILLVSNSRGDRLKNFREVLFRLQGDQCNIQKKRCKLIFANTEFHEQLLTKSGTFTGDYRNALLSDYPVLKSVSKLRSILELAHFSQGPYKIGSNYLCLISIWHGSRKFFSNRDTNCNVTFDLIGKSFTTSSAMEAPDLSKPFSCRMDASQLAVGESIRKLNNSGRQHIISPFSKRFSTAREKYSANGRVLHGLLNFEQ